MGFYRCFFVVRSRYFTFHSIVRNADSGYKTAFVDSGQTVWPPQVPSRIPKFLSSFTIGWCGGSLPRKSAIGYRSCLSLFLTFFVIFTVDRQKNVRQESGRDGE